MLNNNKPRDKRGFGMFKKISKIFNFGKNFVVDIIWSMECLGCGVSGEWICNRCKMSLPISQDFPCMVCMKPCIGGEVHLACSEESGVRGLLVSSSRKHRVLKEAIRLIKYENLREVAKDLGYLLVQKVEVSVLVLNLLMNQDTLVIPVPLHKAREWERGYNQSKLLAQELAINFPATLGSGIVIRHKQTKTQTGFDRKKRFLNMKDAFQVVQADLVKNKNIILVDDVITSGATLDELAKVLKLNGAKEIWGVVLARG